MIITTTPKLLSFAGNPMRYLLTDDSNRGELYSVVKFSFTEVDTVENHLVIISQNGIERTLTLKASPTTTAHLPVGIAGYGTGYWCLQCFNWLIGDLQLSTDYDITMDNRDIILTAKIPSPEYNITQVTSTIVGLVVSTFIAGVIPVVPVDGVMMLVYIDETTLIGQEYKQLDPNGLVRFDVQEYLYAHLLLAPHPRFDKSIDFLYNVYSDYICKYRVAFVNKVNGVMDGRIYRDPLSRYAIGGGLNREDLVENNLLNLDFFDQTDVQSQFLTWSSDTKITDKLAKESLFFAFQTPAYTKFKLCMTYWDSNGANQTTADITALVTITPWSVVEFSVGYIELSLISLLAGDVAKWKVFLVNENGSVISNDFTFELDPRYYENTRYFRFRNSWGVFDSLRCTGNFELNLEYAREQATYISEDQETMFNAPVKSISVKESQLFKANSGWINRDNRDYLRDFERSPEIYEDDNGRLYPVNITSKKSNLAKDGDYNYFLAFEYERAYNDFFFSRILQTLINKCYSDEYSAEYS